MAEEVRPLTQGQRSTALQVSVEEEPERAGLLNDSRSSGASPDPSNAHQSGVERKSEVMQGSPSVVNTEGLKEDHTLFRDLLPDFNDDVARLAESHEFNKNPVPMGLCTGPAVKLARISVLITWTALLGITALSYSKMECAEDGRMSHYPLWILGLWVPFFLICGYMEISMFRYVSIPYVQVTRSWTLAHSNWPFQVYFGFFFIMSQLNRADYATDSLFVASTVAHVNCPGQQISEIWKVIVSQSVFRYLGNIHFEWVALASFALMLLQLVYPFLQSTPRYGQNADYVIGTRRPDGSNATLQFQNLMGENMNFGDALMILCEPNASVTLALLSPAFPRKKAELVLEQDSKDRTEQLHRALSFVRNALTRGLVLVGSVALLENAFQTNMQVTLFGIKCAVARSPWGHHSIPCLLSIVLSITMSVEKTNVAINLLRFSRDIRAQIRPMLEQLDQEQRRSHRHSRSMSAVLSETEVKPNAQWNLEDELAAVRRYSYMLLMATILLLLCMMYALTKLVAVFVCKDSLWNITGCVDLEAAGYVRPGSET